MIARGARARRGYERGFVVSDHADFPSLVRTAREAGGAAAAAAAAGDLAYSRVGSWWQGTAGQRQIIGDQMRAKFGKEPVRARRSAGRIDQPCQRRIQLHGPIMWQRRLVVINRPW